MKKIWDLQKLSISISLCFLLTALPGSFAQALDSANKVELVSPAPGSALIPEKSTIVMRFTGPAALKSNLCDTQFRYWMLGTDSFGRSALFSRIYNTYDSTGLMLMEGHTSKVTPSGIECSIDLGKQIESRSKTGISDLMYKADWAKTYLESHNLASDTASVNKFVDGWKYLVQNPSQISKVTISSLGLNNAFVLQPVVFSAISGARELQVINLTRGANLSTGEPLTVKYSGSPNESPKSVSIFVSSASSNGEHPCYLQSDNTKLGLRTELIYACRIPRVYATGQVQINAISRDLDNWPLLTEPVVVNLLKSATEKLSMVATASECAGCGSGVLRIAGKVVWESDKGSIPLAFHEIVVCESNCPSKSNVKTDAKGQFSFDLRYFDPDPTKLWVVQWTAIANASDLSVKISEKFVFNRAAKPAVIESSKPTVPRFNMKLSVSTKSRINWGDQVVAIVKGSGSGSGTCVAQFQEELKTFPLKAGQTKTIRFDPQYAENKKFALNLGCAANPNWWGRFFDPRYSWNYASVKTYRYVTMVVSNNLDGY